MIVIEKIAERKRTGTFAIIVESNYEFREYFSDQESAFITKQIADDKQFIHINRFESHAYVIVVPQKKQYWQIKEVLRRKGADLQRSLNTLKQQSITISDISGNKEFGQAVVEGVYLSSYQFLRYFRDAEKKRNSLSSVHYFGALSKSELNESVTLWNALFQTKTLVNEPVMSLPSVRFVDKIKTIAGEKGFSATVYEKSWIEQQAMGGILAVNKGSIDPPFFCVLEWKPETFCNQKPIVLIGKGIMYDSGGLSLKPSSGMETMKADMSGAAAVLGVMTALASNKSNKHVIALLPVTDNRPSGNAYAPGDIVKMHNGLFVEVLNTDAEGRMLLADALSFAKQYDPRLVIDIATLTGSANAAVGSDAAVVMGTAPAESIAKLIEAGFAVHERLVQFPLWDDYAELIKSDIADLKNVGGPLAGAITAGKFLECFTSDYPWIHIDIAGSAYNPKGADYRGKGATGMGVRLLYTFINDKN